MIHLHGHDTYGSLNDSTARPEEIVKWAYDNGHKAIAITNHGYMNTTVDQAKACLKYGIKPIYGVEAYEVDDVDVPYIEVEVSKGKFNKKRTPRYHLILLAKNQKGLENLYNITSDACTKHFYTKPRTSLQYIRDMGWNEGIICSTACQGGKMSRLLVSGQFDEAMEYYKDLENTFEDVYIEIQSHDTPSQIEANKCIMKFVDEYNLKYVITTDYHMIRDEDRKAHSIFVAVGEAREVGETYNGCYLQTEEDVYRIMGKQFDKNVIKQGIQATHDIANMIDDNIDVGLDNPNMMPKIEIPQEFENHLEYLRHLVYENFDSKFGHMSQADQDERKERIEMEIPILDKVGYIDYFIMCFLLMNKAREEGIPLGYARGSAGASICLFLLNVTQIDPVKWKLDFSRFANLGRTAVADVDIDISKRRRGEMIDIAIELFGRDNVYPISTFNTFSTKVAIRDVGKVLDSDPDSPYYQQIPHSKRDAVAKMIPTIKTVDDEGNDVEIDTALKKALSSNDELQQIYNEFPLWFKYVMDLEGLPKSRGQHASAIMVTPVPATKFSPICRNSDGEPILQMEMHNLMDDLKLVKLDFLGLKSLDIVDDTLKFANKTWEDVDINRLDLEDKLVYDNIYKTGKTVGVFQMESMEGRKMNMKVQTSTIEDIIAINAFNRPATKDNFPTYVDNKLGGHNELIHPDLEPIFSQSKGVLLYQEQALQIFRYAGFPESEVDNARRAISKKDDDLIASLKIKLDEGLKAKGWNDTQMEEIWKLMKKQATYSFNRAHSVAYGLMSYLMAYLKQHNPVEFMTACLIAESGTDKLSTMVNEAKEMGIKVLPPHINKADYDFTCIPEKNTILFGMMAISGLGRDAITDIFAQRPYKNFNEVVDKTKSETVTVMLVKSGAIPVKDKRKALYHVAKKRFNNKPYTPKKSWSGTINQINDRYGLDFNVIKDHDERLKLYNIAKEKEYYIEQQKKYEARVKKFEAKYMKDEFMWEFEMLSMFITKDPLQESYDKLTHWDDVPDGGKATLLAVVTRVQRKKDKNGNTYAYVDLYTPIGIVETTMWASQLNKFNEQIVKGNSLAVLCKKKDGQAFIDEVKPYTTWLEQWKEHNQKNKK